jgi:hypothetical protein
MKNIEQLNDLFNLDPMTDKSMELATIPESINSNKDIDQEDDYQLARQTMRKLLMKGETTLDELIELSKNSEHPRTYEVAGQFMKTMSDVSKDLLNLQKQVKELKADDPQQKIGTQNNVVFAGSTAELFKALKQNKDNGNIIEQ